ncbi:energy transducer TonB [Muribaculaceae bacterium Isolate-104 (HZI)]|jgi:protein TonB|nr:energy transducer TonB [Muribaculaceae bacterium Isolate-104 (HZI)]
MAKDVDLSSKEWRDIVFEGKNKEFGAYQLRKESDARHNKAMIVIVIVIAILFALAFLVNTVIKAAEARPEDTIEQSMAVMEVAEEPVDEPEEELQRVEEQKVEEVIKEDLLNTAKATEIAIVKDDEVTDELQSQDELKEDDRAIGKVNEDRGVDDIINAQEHKDVVVVEEKTEPDEDYVFDAVEQNAMFPGGDGALIKWLGEHTEYPQVALENGVQGTVRVRFVVKKDGTIGDVKVLKPVDPNLDKEAIRVIKSLPKFIPGKMNGHAVNCYFTAPVRFKIISQN